VLFFASCRRVRWRVAFVLPNASAARVDSERCAARRAREPIFFAACLLSVIASFRPTDLFTHTRNMVMAHALLAILLFFVSEKKSEQLPTSRHAFAQQGLSTLHHALPFSTHHAV